ncbi:DUF218 domain-containing protein [Trichoderma longibrachiatum]|uniref:DUF218-domain-containing protein n=1 Tax=Trichoderma longibrachiatum ATCC 18648 TaxID=983965 RepID=A0A2T4CC13_TRILO|nr:DUF218-domain-containing protein [Trichoderma longibrachiatum ATCC 18648]
MTQTDQIHRDATLVYNYHKMNLPLRPASAIFCLCSLDTRVAAHAAQLYLDGLAPWLIFSGDSGILTKGLFSEPEAVVFANIAREMGVPEDKIIVEPRARNTGENVRFTYDLLRERGMLGQMESLVLVQKPYMERRTYATFRKQWPERGTLFTVTSPGLSFDEYPDASNPRELVTSIMVGDLIRIREYPARGFQIEQEIPDEVWEAGQRLVAAGFDKHLP